MYEKAVESIGELAHLTLKALWVLKLLYISLSTKISKNIKCVCQVSKYFRRLQFFFTQPIVCKLNNRQYNRLRLHNFSILDNKITNFFTY